VQTFLRETRSTKRMRGGDCRTPGLSSKKTRIWTGTDNLHMSARLKCKGRRMPGRGIELRRRGGAWMHEDCLYACKVAMIWQCSRWVVNCLECSTYKQTTWKRRIASKRTAHVQLARESKRCETLFAQSIRPIAQGASVRFLVRCVIDLLRKGVLYYASHKSRSNFER